MMIVQVAFNNYLEFFNRRYVDVYGTDTLLEYVATFSVLPEERKRQRLLVGHKCPAW